MSDNEEKTCPLCTEEMDFTDQQLKPCKCGYKICVWCWHHIMNEANSEGRCPACRSPYDEAKILAMAANCGRAVVNVEQKQKLQRAKWKAYEGRIDLSSFRVIRRNLVYVIGLPVNLADEDLLKRWEYFGQYGKVVRVAIYRPASGIAIQHFANKSCCVYVTYSKEEEAIKCIRSVNNFILEGKPLRACFGTSKYCYSWLKNVPCNNQDCSFLHDLGSPEDSFIKDDTDPALTASMVWGRVQQIIGVINNTRLRSGSILPPAEEPIMSSTEKIAKDISNIRESCVDGSNRSSNFGEVNLEISPTIRTSTGLFACIPTPKTNTQSSAAPVPITRSLELGKESYSPSLESLDKDGNLDVDCKFLSLLSGLSSVSMMGGLEQEHSIPAVANSSVCIDLLVKKPRKKDSEQHDRPSTSQALEEATKSSTSTLCFQKKEDLLAFDDQRLSGSESICHPLSESFSHNALKSLNQSCPHSWNQNDIFTRNIVHGGPRILSSSSLSSNELRTFSKSESNIEYSSAGLDAGKDEHLGRFDNNVAVDSDVAQDRRESYIISSILSMDSDAWDNSLISPHNLDEFLREIDDRHGSFKIPNLQKIKNCSQSRFSFARQEDIPKQISDSDHSDCNIRSLLKKYPASQDCCLDRHKTISFSNSYVASEDRPICSFTSSNNLSDHFLGRSMFRGGQFQDFGTMFSSTNDAYGFPAMVPERYEACSNPSWFGQLTAHGYSSNNNWGGWNPLNSIGDLGMPQLLKNQRLHQSRRSFPATGI